MLEMESFSNFRCKILSSLLFCNGCLGSRPEEPLTRNPVSRDPATAFKIIRFLTYIELSHDVLVHRAVGLDEDRPVPKQGHVARRAQVHDVEDVDALRHGLRNLQS